MHKVNRKDVPHQIQKHIWAIRNNISNYGYLNHILNIGHSRKYGAITDQIDIQRTYRKGKHLNTQDKHYTYDIIKITCKWTAWTLKHITQYLEHCRKWTPSGSTHALHPIYSQLYENIQNSCTRHKRIKWTHQ